MSDPRVLRFAVFASLAFVILVVAVVERSQAAAVTYTLELDPGGTWDLFGQASSGDNVGLASIGVTLQNVETANTLLQTPFIQYFDVNLFTVGMNFAPMTDPVGASQDTITPMPLVYGFGQTAGTLTSPVAPLDSRNVNYAAKLLLANGTYDTNGPQPGFGASSANVFLDMSANPPIPAAGIVTLVTVVPESATLVMLVLGAAILSGAGMFRRR